MLKPYQHTNQALVDHDGCDYITAAPIVVSDITLIGARHYDSYTYTSVGIEPFM
jgi:hypothetical protein